jgi:hypothetical protein
VSHNELAWLIPIGRYGLHHLCPSQLRLRLLPAGIIRLMFNTGRKSGTGGTGGRVEVLKKRHGAGHPSQQNGNLFHGGSRGILTVIKPASISLYHHGSDGFRSSVPVFLLQSTCDSESEASCSSFLPRLQKRVLTSNFLLVSGRTFHEGAVDTCRQFSTSPFQLRYFAKSMLDNGSR